MNCMKCGRETAAEQVFCEDCLLEMEKHPVKPGTVVLLPRRSTAAAPRKVSKRRGLTPEEQVKVLKKRVRILVIALLLCIAVIAAMAYPTVQYLTGDRHKVGQNYNTVVATSAPAEASD